MQLTSKGHSACKKADEAYFYHSNPRGDIYALSSGEDLSTTSGFAPGDIVERYDYSLYGDTIVMDPDFLPRYSGAPQAGLSNTIHSGVISTLSGGGPLSTQIDQEGSIFDWENNELIGALFGVEIGGVEQFFVIISNFTNATPDPTNWISYFHVNEDLQALGVQEGAAFTIYAMNTKTEFGNPFQWGGAWKDDETCYMWMRHRYYKVVGKIPL